MKQTVLTTLLLVVLGLSSVNPMPALALPPGNDLDSMDALQAPPLPVEHILTFESLTVGYRFAAAAQPYASVGITIPEEGEFGEVGFPEVINAYTAPTTRHALRNTIESEFSSDGEDLEIKLDGFTSDRVSVNVGRDFAGGLAIEAVLQGYFVAGGVYELIVEDTATIPNAITAPTVPLTIEADNGAINFIRISYGHAQEPEIIDNLNIRIWQGDPPDLTLTPDTTAPAVHITNPVNGGTTNSYAISGYVDEDRAWGRTVTISTPAIAAPKSVSVSGPYLEDGRQRFYFGAWVDLLPGNNTIRVTARDSAGNTNTASITTTYQAHVFPPPPPVWPDTLDIVVRRASCSTDCGMEITQAIQGWEQIGPTPFVNSNETKLVSGKTTLVRVYAELLGYTAPVANVAAMLRAYRAGVELPGSPLYTPVDKRVTLVPGENYMQQRSDPAKSFNFFLPPEWTEPGTIRLQATVNYGQNPPEGPHKFDVYNSTTYDVTFTETEAFCIFLSRFRSVNEGDVTPTWNEAFQNLELTRQIYPVSPDRLEIDLGSTYRTERLLDTGVDFPDDMALSRLAHEFRRTLGLYYGVAYAGCHNSVFLGLTDDTVQHRGITTYARPVSVSVADSAEFYTLKTAHEIGHAQGMGHVRGDCGLGAPAAPFEDYPSYRNPITGTSYFAQSIGDWGVKLNLLTNSFTTRAPSSNGALMSYCDPSWMSVYTWNRLYNHFTDEAGSYAEPTPEPDSSAAPSAPSAPYLIVGGWMWGGDVLLEPAWMEMRAAGSSDYTGVGAYTIELRDATGTARFTRHFDPEPLQDVEIATTFREVMPALPGITTIALSGGPLDRARTIRAGAATPSISLIAPNTGGTWDATGSREIYWNASDADGDALTYTVFYSADNGVSWRVIASALKQPGTQVLLDELPGCNKTCRVGVAVSDGIHISSDTSDSPFTKRGQPPVVSILNPRPVAAFDYGEQVIFDALVSDWDEKAVPEANLSWKSSINGVLGSGYTISANRLSPGLHNITLTVTDSSGMRTTDTTAVYIGPIKRIYLPVTINKP